MTKDDILKDLPALVSRAVTRYWETRTTQRNKQKQTGKADQGLRSAVTGGAQMDGIHAGGLRRIQQPGESLGTAFQGLPRVCRCVVSPQV